jgi:hypothetical protein
VLTIFVHYFMVTYNFQKTTTVKILESDIWILVGTILFLDKSPFGNQMVGPFYFRSTNQMVYWPEIGPCSENWPSDFKTHFLVSKSGLAWYSDIDCIQKPLCTFLVIFHVFLKSYV